MVFTSLTSTRPVSYTHLDVYKRQDLLTAISPIDGRYRGKTDVLAASFSEFALIKYRVQVEREYFITLGELPLPQLKGVDKGVFETLRNIYRKFSEADAQRIKDIESVTNHDVKAVEYFLKEEFDKMCIRDSTEGSPREWLPRDGALGLCSGWTGKRYLSGRGSLH